MREVNLVVFGSVLVVLVAPLHLGKIEEDDRIVIFVSNGILICASRPRCIVNLSVALCKGESALSSQLALLRRSLAVCFFVHLRSVEIFAKSKRLLRLANGILRSARKKHKRAKH